MTTWHLPSVHCPFETFRLKYNTRAWLKRCKEQWLIEITSSRKIISGTVCARTTNTCQTDMALFYTLFSWHFLFIYRRCCCSLPWSLTTTRHQRPQRARPSNAMTSDLSCCQTCAGVRMEPLPHCGHQWSLRVLCVSLCLIVSFSKGCHVVLVTWLRGNNDVFFFFFLLLYLLHFWSVLLVRLLGDILIPVVLHQTVIGRYLIRKLCVICCLLLLLWNMFGHYLRGDWYWQPNTQSSYTT